MANLLEAYAKRLSLAESVYAEQHAGAKMDSHRKLVVAKLLENSNKYLNEAFENSVGTQRANLGMDKKFTLNLVNVAVPNLIVHDIMIVSPMSAMSGYITYLNYTAGTNKGTVEQGNTFNSVFGLFQENNANAEYTSSAVTEEHTVVAAEASAHKFALLWTPVANVAKVRIGTKEYAIVAAGSEVADTSVSVTGDEITFAAADTLFVADAKVNVAYTYNNEYIPQNDLPLLNAEIKSVALVAHARRIAVYYSQLAAYQAKTDFGFDLGDQLAIQAAGQLAYEIDTEAVLTLRAAAESNSDAATVESALTWSRTLPVGVSKAEHYEGFAEIVSKGSQYIYSRTRKFAANFMLIAPDILPVIQFIKGFEAAPMGRVAGPYFAGMLNGIKVFVTPAFAEGQFVIGVKGDDLMTAAAVYAPYLAIIPTQLLQQADGGTSQGFSTLYDIEILNANLVVEGKVIA